jgi:hypothetical protein
LFTFDADVVLGPRDGVLFGVPSTTLKMTSAWFRAMFTLPQGPSPSSSRSRATSNNRRDILANTFTSTSSAVLDTEIISLNEDSGTLEPLLRMICGLEIPALDTWHAVEPVLYAAEKYDVPCPASIMHALLRTPVFADEPLRRYAAACHFGWAEDARTASTRSLTVNLYHPKNRSVDLLPLFELHHERHKQLRQRIAEPPFLTDAQPAAAAAAAGRPILWSHGPYSGIYYHDV